MRDRDPLLALSEAVANGEAIDWARARDRSDDARTLEQLRVLEAIVTVHRSGARSATGAGAHPSGTAWGPLVILETIGEGSFGRVYRARDPHLQRDVALKLLRAGDSAGGNVVSEARLLARVRHPNVVTIHGADINGGEAGLWMELLQGQTLASWVAAHGPLGAEEAAVIGATLCRAVAAVHQVGLFHRDIKAQNVVREPGGRIVLMDFGAGWDALDPITDQRAIGTPVYLAPEVLNGSAPTVASDLYSLGVLLFFMTTRQYPVAAATLEELRARHLRREQRQLRDIRPDLPSRFVEVVTRAIAFDPNERYESAGALEQALLSSLSTAARSAMLASATVPDTADPGWIRLAAGTRLGAYEVERSLGSGGMGQVYLARDTRLDRHIALKVVPPELAADPDRLARFAREAKTASSLNHPGIAHIYEIGEANGVHFIAMEYVRGEELRARIGRRGLPMSDVIIHATQIADALDEAHTHGIVHRDLKPSNVIVTPRGRIKVLDFGLAKMVGSPDRPDDGRSTRLTDAGLVLGTIDYMSPEQVRGISVDRRSDIFSFGVMLYEMITGRLPFAAESKTDLVYRIAQAQPDPLSRYTYDVPPELERIVRKCLEKEPSRRYQSARDLHVDLSGLKRDSSATMVAVAPQSRLASRTVRVAIMVALAAAAIGTPAAVYYWRAPDTIDSLAVLPDVSAADTAETVMVADVVANSVANSLSLTGSLRVAPRLRRAIAAGAVDPFAEARELGVHGALLVSAKVREGVATLDLRLVDVVHHPRQDWGQQYKLALSELDLAQQQIAAEVADTLNLRFDAEQRRALQVYQLFQRGHAQLSKRTARDLQRAIEFFELAIETDRSYARAWAGLAQAHNLLHIYSIVKPAEAAPAAKAAAEQALSLDARLAAAYTQRALVSFRWDWNWRQAEQEFARALTLDANDSNTRHWAAMFQTAAGQFDEAARLVLDAQAIAPLDPVVRSDLGWVLYMAGRYADAVTESERAIASRPDSHLPHWYLGVALMQLQQYGRAVQELETVVRMTNGQPNFRAELATVLAAAGRRSEAIRIREELLQAGRTSGFVPAYHIALIDAVLGDHNASLEWLEAAAREREGMLVWIGVEPRLGSLRQHPRFNAIAAKIRGDL